MEFLKMHPADQIVEMMQRIYQGGMTTTSGGNLSIMDEAGDVFRVVQYRDFQFVVLLDRLVTDWT